MSEVTEKKGLGKLLSWKWNGIPVSMILIITLICIVGMATGSFGTDVGSTLCWLFALGLISDEIGERIPIFNTWLGGGGMMLMLLPSFLVWKNIIPEKYVNAATMFYSDDGLEFQCLYICLLMCGALLAIDRKVLIQSLVRYIPTVIAGVAVAAVFGLGAGALMGMDVTSMWVYYILPIMGGGNGAGAIPMSQIFAQATGQSADQFYAKAIAILTFANSLCIIVAALLNKLGMMFPKLTGDGSHIMRSQSGADVKDKEKAEEYKPSAGDMAATFLVVGAAYGVARLISKTLLPTIFGISIHQYAYLVLLLTLCNIFNVIPHNIVAGMRRIQKFLCGTMSSMCLCAVGVTMMDFGEFIGAVTIQNLILAGAIVIGAVVGTAVVGHLFGMYAVDSAMTAGLCMANRGGGGDVVVLAAGKRMDLMPYAAVSSRLGGGLVLAFASVMFNILLK